MSDNIVKFRRPEKKPDSEPRRPRGEVPSFVPWLVLVALAIAVYFVQHAGFMG